MKLLRHILLCGFLLLLSCDSVRHQPVPESLCYYRFVKVEEMYDPSDNERFVGFNVIDTPYTQEERMLLIDILKEEHKDFYIADHGDIFVSKVTLPDLENMSYINSEMKRRLDDLIHK